MASLTGRRSGKILESAMSRQITLFKEDLNPSSVLTWEGLLEDLRIESHVLVAGREIDKEIDAVTIFVSDAIGNDGCS